MSALRIVLGNAGLISNCLLCFVLGTLVWDSTRPALMAVALLPVAFFAGVGANRLDVERARRAK